MSDKITAKNLSYNSALPPFLARLHAQAAGSSDSPDPILSARQRPRSKVRSASEEAEDAPLVVDEHGNVVDLLPGDPGEGGEPAEARADNGADDGADDGAAKEEEGKAGREAVTRTDGGARKEQATATFGAAARKRKAVVRVIGGNDDVEDVDDRARARKKDTKVPRRRPQPPDQDMTTLGDAPLAAKTGSKKKAKKIKLSFEDDD